MPKTNKELEVHNKGLQEALHGAYQRERTLIEQHETTRQKLNHAQHDLELVQARLVSCETGRKNVEAELNVTRARLEELRSAFMHAVQSPSVKNLNLPTA